MRKNILPFLLVLIVGCIDICLRITHFSFEGNRLSMSIVSIETLCVLFALWYLIRYTARFYIASSLLLVIYSIDIIAIYSLNVGFELNNISLVTNSLMTGNYIYAYIPAILLFLWVLIIFVILATNKTITIPVSKKKIQTFFLSLLAMLGCVVVGYNAVHSWEQTTDSSFTRDPLIRIISTLTQRDDWFYATTSSDDRDPSSGNIQDGLQLHKNLIILIVESLSASDSFATSKIHDYFPKLDAIMQQSWLFYPHMFANGLNTEQGQVALLQGIEPITQPTDLKSAYLTFTWFLDPLPVFFNKKWYTTSFITSTSLDFLWMGTYMQQIWFQTILGSEDFSWEKSYFQESKADQVVYDEILRRLDTQKNTQNFITAQTTSVHFPYRSPYGDSPEDTYRYVDDTISQFINQLYKTDYFSSGILIVVGDHRKMKIVDQDEINVYGDTAYNMTIAAIFWLPGHKKVSTFVGQTDIYYSIINGRSKKMNYAYHFNNLLSQEFEKKWTILPIYGRKELLDVYNGETKKATSYQVKDIYNIWWELWKYTQTRLDTQKKYRNTLPR